MPLRSERPIVRVEPGSVHTIETGNPENLFGLWSIFQKCSPAMADGRRYENIAWRLWARETFCCAPDHTFSPRSSLTRKLSDDLEMPSLSSSVESTESTRSDSAVTTTTSRSNSSFSRPGLRRNDSTESKSRQKHITPIDLEKIVQSIQEKNKLEPLSPLPPQLTQQTLPLHQKLPVEDTTPRPTSPPRQHFVPESSTSTVATALGSDGMSPPMGSDVSTSTDLSSHSIVRGFAPGRISSSIRSSTNLHATPTPILKASSHTGKVESIKEQQTKKKAPMFTLGGSSDEGDNSSFETSMYMAKRSSLSENLKKPAFNRKTTSFKDEVTTRTINDVTSEESEEAIESDSEEDDSDDNAIEDDDYDDDDQWEDDDNSGPSSVNDRELFQRVDSKPNLRPNRSLLTNLLHEKDRANALQNAASRSSPALRRSRTSSPNGPSLAASPQDEGLMMPSREVPRSKPIIMTTSNTHPPALSPRTTRRNMLQTELTESLRKNLLWERQQKNATTNAVNKRHHSAVSIPALRRAMTTNDIKGMTALPREGMGKPSAYRDMAKNNSSYNDYFDQGLQEYHQKGW